MTRMALRSCSLLSLSLMIGRTDAFIIPTPAAATRRNGRTRTSLASTLRTFDEEDDEYHKLLQQARAYARNESSDSSNLAKDYLWGILELESACVSGNLLGEDDLCAVDDVADVVVRLREKATAPTVDKNVAPWLASFPAIEPPSPTALGVATATFTLFCLLFREFHLDSTPFTFEEWVWAIRGGYAFDMVDHYLRNGGV